MSDKELIGGHRVLSYKTVPFAGNLSQKRLTEYLNNYAGGGWKAGRKVRTATHRWLYFESGSYLLILIHEQQAEQLTSILLEREG